MFASRLAFAQSTGSFPDAPSAPEQPTEPPAPPTPPAQPQAPVTPPAQPSAPVEPVAPTPPASTRPPTPAPTIPSDHRYPTLPRYQTQPPQLAAPTGFYPPVLPYEEGQPIPPGYSVEYRPASGLIVGGAVTFLASYGVAFGLGVSQDFENGTGWMAVPVIGPWAAIASRSFSCKKEKIEGHTVPSADCMGEAYDEVTFIAATTATGLVQATGAVLFLVGLASGQQELVRHEATDLEVVPELSSERLGLRAVGRF